MSEMEKDAQTGRAVVEYLAAQEEVVRYENLIRDIFQNYYRVGHAMHGGGNTHYEPKISPQGKLVITGGDADLLVTKERLIELVADRDAARKRKAAAAEVVKSLGAGAIL